VATDEEIKQNQDTDGNQDIASMDSDPLESGQLNTTDAQSVDNSTDKLPDELDDEIIDDTTQKKAKSINKILFIAIGALVFIIIVIMIMFFMGVFDPKVEEAPPVDPNDPTAVVVEPVIPEIPAYDFKMTDINVARLNDKLSLLKSSQPTITPSTNIDNTPIKKIDTKGNNAFYDDELESLFAENDIVENKEEIKEEQPKNELLNNIDNQEDILVQDDLSLIDEVKLVDEIALVDEIKSDSEKDISQDNPITDTLKQIEIQTQESSEIVSNEETKKEKTLETIPNNQFLKFIQVATLKYTLYTQFLREIKAVDARISICQNEQGRIQIFIGPFLDDVQRNFVVEKINKNVVTDAFALEFTQEEFYKRCGINDPS
jgi:hypothetical protein